jgi:DeoR/GlpR family transcriptional regulator of sugar metabolism
VVVADHSKLQMSGFSTFAAPGDITSFVTSSGAEAEALEPFRQAGVEVIIAE